MFDVKELKALLPSADMAEVVATTAYVNNISEAKRKQAINEAVAKTVAKFAKKHYDSRPETLETIIRELYGTYATRGKLNITFTKMIVNGVRQDPRYVTVSTSQLAGMLSARAKATGLANWYPKRYGGAPAMWPLNWAKKQVKQFIEAKA